MNFHEPPKNREECDKILTIVSIQVREVLRGDDITCICGRSMDSLHSWRCFHCGLWLCKMCATQHFGIPEKSCIE